MTEKAQSSTRVYIPATCPECNYPTELGAYTPDEALVCPECGHELTQHRLTVADFEQISGLIPLGIPLFCGTVYILLVVAGSLVFGLLYRMSDPAIMYTSGFIFLLTALPIVLFISRARKINLTRTGYLALVAWVLLLIAQVCLHWIDLYGKGINGTVLLYFACTISGVLLLITIAWRVLLEFPLERDVREGKRIAIFAYIYVLLLFSVFAVMRALMSDLTQQDWFRTAAYITCLCGIAIVSVPSGLFMSALRRWEQITGLSDEHG